MTLRLIDTPRGTSAPDVPDAVTFLTCLRQITFLDTRQDCGLHANVLEDGAAYAHLVEVVCGLHSPMAGETQIQGQFKQFLDGLDTGVHGDLKRLGQRVLGDAREIREAHLRGLGSRSYGSAVRRHVRDIPRVALIGAGTLAREIHEYVDDDHDVDVWTRARLSDSNVDSSIPSPAATAVVVAAPVSSDAITRVATAYPDVRCVIDLRADDERTPIAVSHVLTLQDLFSSHQTDVADERLRSARAAAALCGRSFDVREELRPFGWEDLCA